VSEDGIAVKCATVASRDFSTGFGYRIDNAQHLTRTLPIICFCVLASFQALAAPGTMILLNGTSSAGKSSLAEAMVKESKTPFEIISLDGFLQTKDNDIVIVTKEHYDLVLNTRANTKKENIKALEDFMKTRK
jgi:ABC-type dipeptide/oligopeptide/nickel transport system ATPase subunit